MHHKSWICVEITPRDPAGLGATSLVVGPRYRPHLVVDGQTDYLGVTFTGPTRDLDIDKACVVDMFLMYPNVDYSALQPEATFTMREGPFVTATGRVIAKHDKEEIRDEGNEKDDSSC